MKMLYPLCVVVKNRKVSRNNVLDGVALSDSESKLISSLKPIANRWINRYLAENDQLGDGKITLQARVTDSPTEFSVRFKVMGVMNTDEPAK